MGIVSSEVRSISPSQITGMLLSDNKPKWDQKAIMIGRQQHARILGAMREQFTPTLAMIQNRTTALDIPHGRVVSQEKKITALFPVRKIAIRVVPDAIIQSRNSLHCIEIKSRISSTNLLQLAYGSMATVAHHGERSKNIEGVLYTYGRGEDRVASLPDGGRSHWDDAVAVAVLASNILTYSRQAGYENQMIEWRRELDSIWERLSPALIGNLVSRVLR